MCYRHRMNETMDLDIIYTKTEVRNNCFSCFHWQLLLPYLLSHRTSRQRLVKRSHMHCRRSGSRSSQKTECAQVHGYIPVSWENCQMKGLNHYPSHFKCCGSQVKSSVTVKGETSYPFLKWVERKTHGTIDQSASLLYLAKSWSTLSWVPR